MTPKRVASTLILCSAVIAIGCSSGGGVDAGTTTSGTTTSATGTTTGGTTTTTTSGTGTTSGTTTGSIIGAGTTTGGSLLGAPCDPTASPDRTCAPYGYVCDATSSTCQLPGNLLPCRVSVGCSTGLSCLATGASDNGVCAQDCGASDECLDPTTSCSPFGMSTTTACLPNVCRQPYIACDAGAMGDGTCYPATGTAALFCVQGGSAADNYPCNPTRADGGDGLCGIGSLCVNYGPGVDGGPPPTGCAPLCAAGAPSYPDGGPGCADHYLCVGLTTTLGACLPRCVTASTCPAPLTQCVAVTGGNVCIP